MSTSGAMDGRRSYRTGRWTLPVEPTRISSMTSGLWQDIGALTRSIRLAGVVPAVRRRAADYLITYDQVVAPIVESTLDDPEQRDHVGHLLRAAGIKLGFLISGYAAMAGVPFRADLALLGSAAGRVYDDLVDDFGCDELDRRLAILFEGGTFVPRSGVERLLHELYQQVERRLGRDRDDPIFGALVALHKYQTRSRRQNDPAIPATTLADITHGKGGHATVVLFALTRPAMSDHEVAVIHELGGLLQLVDDYQDVVLDRQAGITTAVTRGEVTLRDICRQLRDLRSTLRGTYERVRPLFSVVYVILWMSFLRRHWPRLGTVGSPNGTPLDVLLRPGDNLLQKASQRRQQGA